MTRDEIIARLAEKFGPHKAPVPRDTGNPRYDRGQYDYVPDGNNEQATTIITFLADDGHNAMRALTYGEIADALCDPAGEVCEAAPLTGIDWE